LGLFEKLFRPKDAAQAEVSNAYFRTLTAYTPAFTTWRGSIYEMELTRAAIHAIATHSSKLKPEVVGTARPLLKQMLATATSEFQTTSQFLYRARTILEMETTLFIVPITDAGGVNVVGLWPCVPQRVEIVEVKYDEGTSEPWLRYTFSNGQKAAIEYRRVAVLTKFQYLDDFFGTGNQALSPTLDLLDMQRQGMTEAVKSAAAIRFMAKLGQALRPEDIKKERDRFAADNLSSDNTSGMIIFDSKYVDFKQIEQQPWLIDAEQMTAIKENVFSYFGVNEDILQNSYDENKWNAFYEGNVEPFALQLGLGLTTMVFSPREIAFGNGIMFSSNRLQYASNTTKVSVVTQLVDRGLMSNYGAADVFSLPQPPGPERWVIRGEYIDIANLPTNTVDNAKTYLKPPATTGGQNAST
jgi:hypothetical protein